MFHEVMLERRRMLTDGRKYVCRSDFVSVGYILSGINDAVGFFCYSSQTRYYILYSIFFLSIGQRE